MITFHVDRIDQFSSLAQLKYSTFLFCEQADSRGDIIFVGCECGTIAQFLCVSRRPREDLISTNINDCHLSAVTCLIYSKNKRMLPQRSRCEGLLISGSRDNTIKIWNSGDPVRPLLQTCRCDGSVSAIVDGNDGSFIACTANGSITVFSCQDKNFEVVHSLKTKSSHSALAVHTIGMWQCFSGDSDGSISLFRKASVCSAVDEYTAAPSALSPHAVWKDVHTLGVSYLLVSDGDSQYLFSLGYDGRCNVLDIYTGFCYFVVKNPRNVMFSGCLWKHVERHLYLSDELGFLEVVSTSSERVISSVELARPHSDQHVRAITTCHNGGVTGKLAAHKAGADFASYFLVLSRATHPAATAAKPESVGRKESVVNAHLRSKPSSLASLGLSTTIDLLQLTNEHSMLAFCGHDGAIVDVGAYCRTRQQLNDAASKRGNAFSAGLISHEERVFFTAGLDSTIRCWGEIEGTERYSFKSKGADITAMLYIWGVNAIATGHDDGSVCLWHADAGSRVVSTSLKASITCLCEASSGSSHVLLGSDINGAIAVWNLTDYRLRPSRLCTDALLHSRHDEDMPGVTCLAFHSPSETVFSGGDDCSLRMWKLGSDASDRIVTPHVEPLCGLRCTQSFFLSGCCGGSIVLWRVLHVKNERRSSITLPYLVIEPPASPAAKSRLDIPAGRATSVRLCIAAKWAPQVALDSFAEARRAVFACAELSPSQLFVVDSACSVGRSQVWRVTVVPNSTSNSSSASAPYIADLASRSEQCVNQMLAFMESEADHVSSANDARDFEEEDSKKGSASEAFTVYTKVDASVDIKIVSSATLVHGGYEPTCALLSVHSVAQGEVVKPPHSHRREAMQKEEDDVVDVTTRTAMATMTKSVSTAATAAYAPYDTKIMHASMTVYLGTQIHACLKFKLNL